MNEAVATVPEKDDRSLTVKLARREDAEALVGLLNKASQYKLKHGDDAWASVPYTPQELEQRIKKGNTYTAWLGDELVGTMLLLWEDEMTWGKQPPIAAYAHQLAVQDGHHGHNLGGQLLDWASEQAAAHGRKFLRIDLPTGNDGLRSYYESQGFTWVEDREIHAPHAVYMAALYERPAADR
jgi:GNAT superfamily N-acetyltransferase